MLEEQLYSEKDQISIIVFEVGDEAFAIDLLDVKEIIQAGQIRHLPKSFDFVEGIYNYRGDIIHIINLEKKLKLKEYLLYKKSSEEIKEPERTQESDNSEKKDEKEKSEKDEKDEKTYEIIKIDKTNGESRKKFIIIVNIESVGTIGFFVDQIHNVAHIDTNKIVGLSPIFQTSISAEYIKGILKFDDKPRILIDLGKILSETEQTSIQKELSSLIRK